MTGSARASGHDVVALGIARSVAMAVLTALVLVVGQGAVLDALRATGRPVPRRRVWCSQR